MRNATRAFYRSLFVVVLPIALQNLITTLVSSADVVMLGYVSQTALSAVSLANQVQFVLNLFFMGLTLGTTMLTAQYWGKGDREAIERLLGIAIRLSMAVAVLFFLATTFFSRELMGIFTPDEGMREAGAVYLQIVGVSYLMMGLSQMYLCVMKSVERVKKSTVISSVSLLLNILLNAVFIFGLFGMPKLGVAGVALATTLSRLVELVWCAVDSQRNEVLPIQFSLLLKHDPVLFRDFMHYSLPVIGNEIVWGGAYVMYSVIMGHLGSDMVAAHSVATVARNLGIILCTGIASGGAILLGKKLGEMRMEEAKADAARLLRTTLLFGFLGAILIIAARPLIMNMVELTNTAFAYLDGMLWINAYYLLGKALNTTLICGIFCAGGDSKFGFIMDAIVMWGIALPLGFLSAFVFKLPVMTVYFVICLDEFIKLPAVLLHYRRRRWLANITRNFPSQVNYEEA